MHFPAGDVKGESHSGHMFSFFQGTKKQVDGFFETQRPLRSIDVRVIFLASKVGDGHSPPRREVSKPAGWLRLHMPSVVSLDPAGKNISQSWTPEIDHGPNRGSPELLVSSLVLSVWQHEVGTARLLEAMPRAEQIPLASRRMNVAMLSYIFASGSFYIAAYPLWNIAGVLAQRSVGSIWLLSLADTR